MTPIQPAGDTVPRPPPVIPGFEHIKRYWDAQLGLWVARVLPGEFYTSRSGEAIATVLGSCVAVCMRDAQVGIAGLNHFMLPEDGGSSSWGAGISAATRYGSFAMEQLVNSILKAGGDRYRMEAKVFGGGAVLKGVSNIGLQNVSFAHEYLINEDFRIVAENTGGNQGRRIVYLTATGVVRMKKITSTQDVAREEDRYLHTLDAKPVSGGMELFD